MKIYYPKQSKSEVIQNLVKTCRANDIEFIEEKDFQKALNASQLIVDAIFGYSFKGEIRQPFDSIIKSLKEFTGPVISVDVPSGWEIDSGNHEGIFEPACVVSLGVPKKCMIGYKGLHFLGGRFMPKKLLGRYGIALAGYQGSSQFTELKQSQI